jgi:hypothetical protein
MGRECSTLGEKRKRAGFWWESQRKRGKYEDLEVGWRIILKLILEK